MTEISEVQGPSPQEKPEDARRASRLSVCLNCGESFPAGPRGAEFCSRPCIKEFDNRRVNRGADLYDFMMIMRYERSAAAKFKVWGAMCRLAAKWREEDIRERGGRRSWRRLQKVIESRLPIFSRVLVKRK